jgi:hypothetical protein
MKRITPEQVLAAYKQTGATPSTGEFYYRGKSGRVRCCGAGVVLLADGFTNRDRFAKEADLRYGRDYMSGFWRGFDGISSDEPAWCHPTDNEEFTTGLADGLAAAQAVFAPTRTQMVDS